MAETEPNGQKSASFTQWQHQRLLVFPIGNDYQDGGDGSMKLRENNGSWFLGLDKNERYRPHWTRFLIDKLSTFQKDSLGVALNPRRNWSQVLGKKIDWVAWDDEVKYADLVDDVMEKLGSRGWELVGIQQAAIPGGLNNSRMQFPMNYYLFKRPGSRIIEPPAIS